MNISREIKNTSNLVMEILKQSPKARNSDNYLYYAVLATLGKRNGIDIEKISVPHFLLHLKEYGFPCFETVRRARQKIQASFPELSACADVEAERIVNEEIYRDYARRKW
jgi:hypothetical protein